MPIARSQCLSAVAHLTWKYSRTATFVCATSACQVIEMRAHSVCPQEVSVQSERRPPMLNSLAQLHWELPPTCSIIESGLLHGLVEEYVTRVPAATTARRNGRSRRMRRPWERPSAPADGHDRRSA